MKFFCEVAIGLAVGAIPALFLSKPLTRFLADVCGPGNGAIFWSRYTWTLILIAPVLFATMIGDVSQNGSEIDSSFLERTFKTSLLGTFMALVAVGIQLARTPRPGPKPG